LSRRQGITADRRKVAVDDAPSCVAGKTLVIRRRSALSAIIRERRPDDDRDDEADR
jgi:hypothetical protein